MAAVVAAAVLTQAESVSRLLPRLVAGDGHAVGLLAGWLVVVGAARRARLRSPSGRPPDRWSPHARRCGPTCSTGSAPCGPTHDPTSGPPRAAALTTTAIDALEPWVRSYLPGLVLAVVVPLAVGLRILSVDLWSAAILVVVVPLIPVFMILIGMATETRAASQWAALQRLAGRFLDALTGMATLRLFGRADAQVERVRAVTERYRHATMRTLRGRVLVGARIGSARHDVGGARRGLARHPADRRRARPADRAARAAARARVSLADPAGECRVPRRGRRRRRRDRCRRRARAPDPCLRRRDAARDRDAHGVGRDRRRSGARLSPQSGQRLGEPGPARGRHRPEWGREIDAARSPARRARPRHRAGGVGIGGGHRLSGRRRGRARSHGCPRRPIPSARTWRRRSRSGIHPAR